MAPLISFIVEALNRNFRPPGPTAEAMFPPDEFGEEEARRLATFCDRVAISGYDFIYDERDDQRIRDILDLAAEYGAFVDHSASPWYLGIFVIAECVMEPYASDSFSSAMFRSQVFQIAHKSAKDLAGFLMVNAIFCDRPQTASVRVDDFLEAAKTAHWSFSEIAPSEVLLKGIRSTDH